MKMHSARLEPTLATTRLGDEHGQGSGDVAPGDAPSTADHDERGDPVAREVARLLRMDVKTVYELAKAESLPCVRLGRHFRFGRRAIVGAFVAKIAGMQSGAVLGSEVTMPIRRDERGGGGTGR